MTHPPRPAARSIVEAIRRVVRLPHRGEPCEATYLLREAVLLACQARPDVPELVELADFVDAYDALPTRGRWFFNKRHQSQTPPAAQPARRTA